MTHPGRCSQALLPSNLKIGAENNKVVALWDIMRQPCIKHAIIRQLIGAALPIKPVRNDMHARQSLARLCGSIDSLNVPLQKGSVSRRAFQGNHATKFS